MGIPRDRLSARALAAVEAAERGDRATRVVPDDHVWEMTLPYPPTVNTYYRNVSGKTLISKRGRAYRKTVSSMVARSGMVPMRGLLMIDIAVFLPDKRRRDLDNLLKSLADSLQHGGVYEDDTQIRDWHIYDAGMDRPEGHVIVRLKRWAVT